MSCCTVGKTTLFLTATRLFFVYFIYLVDYVVLSWTGGPILAPQRVRSIFTMNLSPKWVLPSSVAFLACLPVYLRLPSVGRFSSVVKLQHGVTEGYPAMGFQRGNSDSGSFLTQSSHHRFLWSTTRKT